MSQTQETTTDEQVEPNARYDAVFGTNYAGLDPDSDRMEDLREETTREAGVLAAVEDEQDRLDEQGVLPDEDDREDRDPLSWDHVSPTDDPQLLASICSFFTGVSSGEPVEEIRRKLRTADVEHYANVYLVVSGILDPGGDGPAEGEDHV